MPTHPSGHPQNATQSSSELRKILPQCQTGLCSILLRQIFHNRQNCCLDFLFQHVIEKLDRIGNISFFASLNVLQRFGNILMGIDQTQQFYCKLFQAAWVQAKSKKFLWERIRGYFFNYFVNSWHDLYYAIAYQKGMVLKIDTS